jgi:hypothetical protein
MKVRLATLVAVALLGVVTAGTPAFADTQHTTGNATSWTNWIDGSVQRTQHHTHDDISFDDTGGIAVDMRWVKCGDASVHGNSIINITVAEGARLVGTDFLANTCFRLQYRGFITTGAFEGDVRWNESFA